jgi:anti-sigma B factor antagonist
MMSANPAVPTPTLKLTTERTPDATVVRCVGRITSVTNPVLLETVRGLLPEGKRVVLDLTEVDYVDSSGLGALVSVYVSGKRANCKVDFVNFGSRIKDLLRITRLAALFEGHEDMLGLTPD